LLVFQQCFFNRESWSEAFDLAWGGTFIYCQRGIVFRSIRIFFEVDLVLHQLFACGHAGSRSSLGILYDYGCGKNMGGGGTLHQLFARGHAGSRSSLGILYDYGCGKKIWEGAALLFSLSALMDLYIHPLYVLVSKIFSSILNSPAPIHFLYHPLSTLSIVGPTCHFI
jgi:hypothetical protein